MKEWIRRHLGVIFTIALIAWGIFVVVVYVGVPVHGTVLATDATVAGCANDAYWCRGIQLFFPAMWHSIVRWVWSAEGETLTPFAWFALLWAIAYGGALGWRALKDGEATVRLTLSPLRLGIGFVVLLWILFTAMSLGDNNGMPFRRLFEPSPQVYANAGTEALDLLQQSFQSLQERGCLRFVGVTDRNLNVYDLKALCMQGFFVSRVLTHLILITLLALLATGFGSLILRAVRWKPPTLAAEATFAAAAGCCGMVALLWLMAAVGLFTQWAIWLLLIGIAAVSHRHILQWLRRCRSVQWEVAWRWSDLSPILGWLLLSYIAFNFLTVIRPFPIGWDDLGVYLNKPRLLVSYGTLIPQMGTFQWEYLTALGFGLFGYDSLFGATAAMIINWGAGALAVATVYAFARSYLPRGAALAGLLYYTLPLVGHFSFADMKIDNAVFAMGTLAIFAAMLAVVPPHHGEEHAHQRADWRWAAIAGMCGGFAFGFKVTAAMVIFAVGIVLAGAPLGWMGALGAAFAALGILFRQQLNLADVLSRLHVPTDAISKPVLTALLLVPALALLGFAVSKRRPALRGTAMTIGAFSVALLVSIAPWIMYNSVAHGRIIPALLLNPPNTIQMSIDPSGTAPPSDHMKVLPPELAVDTTSPICQSTAKTEELDRYWGFGTGWTHYALLPWRTVMNIDSAGYYVTTMPALLLFPLLLLLPFFWKREQRWLRLLFAATILLIVLWMFLANGILWYGIGMFLGLSVGVAALAVQGPNPVARGAAGVLIGASLLSNFAHREWQYNNMRNLYEYMLGKVSGAAMQERTIPHYDDVRDVVVERAQTMPDRPFIYRVGTFIPYFLPRSPELIPLADNQLELFKCLNQEGDPQLTLRRFQALGFNSIIFDTNTHTIEQDPNGTLHQKVQAFLTFLNTPNLGVRVLVNDPEGGIAFILLP
jgi:hypothetical protein